MALLGEDGRGYELARKMELYGVWRSWLGDSLYPHFVPFLSSSAAWESFMKSDDSKSRAQIQLQLRARALLFDKASVSLFLSPAPSTALNPAYLKLHGDDVYYTLESAQEGGQQRDGVASSSMPSKSQSRSAFKAESRFIEPEFENRSQRFRHEEFPENWYNQFFEKLKASRQYGLQGDRESDKRTPEEMSTYVRLAHSHKKRRYPFVEGQSAGSVNSVEDASFFPETMFTLNSVPDTALPLITRPEENKKLEFRGVLDTLPRAITRNSVMMERLGMRPEYLNTEQGGYQHHSRSGLEVKKATLSEDQALQVSQKVVISMLRNSGFDSATELPVEVASQLLNCHVRKLGSILKILADSYRKQCSAFELIKMFLHSTKHSNLGALAELVKEGTRVVQQTPQVQGMHPHLQQQHHNLMQQGQQIPRAMHPQMQQMVNSQNIAFHQQQQWDRMRRRQAPSSRPGSDQLVQVKLENPADLPVDSNIFNAVNNRHPRMQFRQQQLAMPNFQAQQPSNQFRQMASLPIQATSQVHSPNMSISRAPPVKVEGFQELMGGDTSLKHDSDSNKLMTPPK